MRGGSEVMKSSDRELKVTKATPLTCDVLEEDKWDVSLAAEFDEMRPLEREASDQRISFVLPLRPGEKCQESRKHRVMKIREG